MSTFFHAWTCSLKSDMESRMVCCVVKSSRLIRSRSRMEAYTWVSAPTETTAAAPMAAATMTRTLICRLEKLSFMGASGLSEKGDVLGRHHLGERALGILEAEGHGVQEREVEFARRLGRGEPEDVGVDLDHRAVGDRRDGAEAARAARAQEGRLREALACAANGEQRAVARDPHLPAREHEERVAGIALAHQLGPGAHVEPARHR